MFNFQGAKVEFHLSSFIFHLLSFIFHLVTTQPMQLFSGVEMTRPQYTVVPLLKFLSNYGNDHNI